MKQKLLFLAVLCSMSMAVKAQTYLGTSSFATSVNNPLPNQAAIEVRELNRGLRQTGSLGEAPSIGLHWANRVWGHFLLGADGIFRLMNDERSAYSPLYVSNFFTTGNVGIGTTTPQAKLDIENNILIGLWEPAWGVRIKANFPNYNGGWSRGFCVTNQDNSSNFIGLGAVGECSNGIATMERAWIGQDYNSSYMNFLPNGNIGIGNTNPQANLHIGKQEAPACSVGQSTRLILQPYGHVGGPWKFICRDNTSSAFLDLFYGDTHSITIHHSGSVGIGTTTPDQKLTVKGKIHAEKVIVDLNIPVADYVFAKDYDLMPLHKVEQYVQQNSHLPDIPSASEIKEEGLSVGEMQNKLLKKIEELTLYAIEQNRQIAQQNKEIEQLQQQNNQMQELEKRIKKLKKK